MTGRLSGLWVAAVALGAPFAGCSRPPAPGGPPAAEAAGAPRPAPPPGPQGPALPAKVLDFQLFHPYSSLREASLPQDEARAARIGLPGEYGVAVLVEAVNESGALLEPPVLDGDFALELEGGGAVRCTLQKWNGVWSHDPGGRSPWRQEGGVEAFWRPAERVRMLATASCGEPWLADAGLSAFRVQLAIRARVAGREKEASSGRLELGLPAAAGVAQVLVLPGGSKAAASADLVVRDDRFRAGVEPLRSAAGRADQVQREPVPGAVPDVRGRAGPVAYRADGIALAHWTDAAGVPKGSRRLAVTWTLAADPSTGVAERERAAGAAARLQRARQALGAARELAQGAPGDPGRPAEAPQARAGLRAAQAEERAARAERDRADAVVAQVRGPLAAAVACDRIQLVTNRRVRAPDGEGAAEACRALLLSDEVTFSQEYLLDRYEVPLALVVVAEGKPVVHLVASEPLARFDPR